MAGCKWIKKASAGKGKIISDSPCHFSYSLLYSSPSDPAQRLLAEAGIVTGADMTPEVSFGILFFPLLSRLVESSSVFFR